MELGEYIGTYNVSNTDQITLVRMFLISKYYHY